jgi:hypothetical protein
MSVEVVSEVQLVVVPDEPQVDVEDLLGEAVLRVLPMWLILPTAQSDSSSTRRSSISSYC